MKQLLLLVTLSFLSVTTSFAQVPANGDVQNASLISSYYHRNTNVRLDLASPDSGGHNGCSIGGFTSVYYKFTALSTGYASALIEDSSGYNIGNSLAIFYSAPDLNVTDASQLTLVSDCVYGSETYIDVTEGNSYYIAIHRSNGGSNLSNITITQDQYVPQTERNALMALYNQTNGANWANNKNWGSTKPVSSWHGVAVYDGNVDFLNLRQNNLTGSLPAEIGDFSELTLLNLSGNSFTDSMIPSEIGNLSNLEVLDLSQSQLTGSIPASLTNLTNLEHLNLSAYYFIGGMDAAFSGNLPDLTGLPLQTLNLEYNYFQFGDIESQFTSYLSNIPSFTYTPQGDVGSPESVILNVNDSHTFNAETVSGTQNNYQWYKDDVLIPDATGTAFTVTVNSTDDYGVYTYKVINDVVTGLTLNGPPLSVGGTPSSHPDYAALVAIYNSTDGANWTNNTNWLDDSKPLSSWYGISMDNNRVTKLNLGDNNLTGQIPSEIGDLTALKELSFPRGHFNGTSIPTEIGNLGNLEALYLHQSRLTGNVPESFKNLTNLKTLYLTGYNNDSKENSFYGTFPDLTALPLEILWMESNYFQFGDLETEYDTYKTNIANFSYSPQANLGEETRIPLNDGDTHTFNTEAVSGSQNTYQWYKDYSPIEGATDPSYTVTINSEADYGTYLYTVNSDIIPDLQLLSNTMEVYKDPTSSPDYDALVALYDATYGPYQWINRWDLNSPIDTWHGVTVVDNRVTQLDLYSNNLRGTIPTEIGDLTALTSLSLYDNQLEGNLPTEIGNLTQLSNLDVQNNKLEGQIPTSIQNLTNLQSLWLDGNSFSGELPDLSGLSSLGYLYIQNNNFVFGDFENEFQAYKTNVPTFEYAPQANIGMDIDGIGLNIGESHTFTAETISGSQNKYQWYKDDDNGLIPGATDTSYTVTVNSLEDYGYYYYQITSDIVTDLTIYGTFFLVNEDPSSHSDYDALVAIYNATNGDNWTNSWNINAPLSIWHGVTLENGRVTKLALGNNNLTGHLPPEIGDLSELTNLWLWSNQLTGNIPPELGNLSKLVELDLSPNKFSGAVPEELGNLSNLEILWLNQNGSIGTIPQSFTNLTKLRELHLLGSVGTGSEFNSSVFYGDFPDLTALPLEKLWMQNNYFTFADIADEFAHYEANIADFVFNPQYTVDEPEEVAEEPGETIILTLNEETPSSNRTGNERRLNGNGYQWFKDSEAIDGANSNSYTITNAQPDDSGVYYCEITNPNVPGMVITRQGVSVDVGGSLSNEEQSLNTLRIYPNPVKNLINIKYPSNKGATATLFDISGRMILTQELSSDLSKIDISHVKSGTYLLQLKMSTYTITKRIIKN